MTESGQSQPTVQELTDLLGSCCSSFPGVDFTLRCRKGVNPVTGVGGWVVTALCWEDGPSRSEVGQVAHRQGARRGGIVLSRGYSTGAVVLAAWAGRMGFTSGSGLRAEMDSLDLTWLDDVDAGVRDLAAAVGHRELLYPPFGDAELWHVASRLGLAAGGLARHGRHAAGVVGQPAHSPSVGRALGVSPALLMDALEEPPLFLYGMLAYLVQDRDAGPIDRLIVDHAGRSLDGLERSGPAVHALGWSWMDELRRGFNAVCKALGTHSSGRAVDRAKRDLVWAWNRPMTGDLRPRLPEPWEDVSPGG